MMRNFGVALALLAVTGPVPVGAASTTTTTTFPESAIGSTIEITPVGATRVVYEGFGHRNAVRIAGYEAGLALTETTTLNGYLEGIAEVPFAWPPEALKAQAVAARTYLAWTLSRGRSSSGRTYDYDICATTACQVYAGVDVVEGWGGDRWKAAVEATTDEILLYRGAPAQALYSSTSGGRTRNVEDIFPGASPTPYLVAVDSKGEASPFVDWTFEITEEQMSTLLHTADLVRGAFLGVTTETTTDGNGPWSVVVEGSDGVTRIGTWELRSKLNAAAATALPDVLPVMRPDVGRRYPQTIMSPTFTIEPKVTFIPPDNGPPRIEHSYVIVGKGWGHLVGMSQFGAEAMAAAGAGYSEILNHYYTGLTPERAPGVLPEDVTVGLATERDMLSITSDGPVDVSIDGEVVAEDALGTWRFEADGSDVKVVPPVGLGLPPKVLDLRVNLVGVSPVSLAVRLGTAAEARVLEQVGGSWKPLTDWKVFDAGWHTWMWAGLHRSSWLRSLLRVEVRSPNGASDSGILWVPGVE